MIVTEKYVYDDTYPSFKARTDQKEIESRLNTAFIKNLGSFDASFTRNSLIKIADIACGPADTLIKHLINIDFRAGIDIRATDYSIKYAGDEHAAGQAYYNLLEAKKSQKLPIVDFSVKRGDAFRGNLNDLLSKSSEPLKYNTFKLAYFSHGMYHAHSDEGRPGLEKVDTILFDIAHNVLDVGGVGIMYHTAFAPQTVRDFGSRYGNRAERKSASDTPANEISDPPLFIVESCKKQRIPCYTLGFDSSLFFSDNVKEWTDVFQDPSKYEKLLESFDVLEDYNVLSFIVQRSPNEMAEDNSNTGLKAYIKEIMSALKVNKNNRWYLPMLNKMQVILHPEASLDFQERIEAALEKTKSQFL